MELRNRDSNENSVCAQVREGLPWRMRRKPRRFKIQRRVDLLARDQSNKPYLLGVVWRTVLEADRQTVAEKLLLKVRHDYPRREYRLAEEWPVGSNLRELK